MAEYNIKVDEELFTIEADYVSWSAEPALVTLYKRRTVGNGMGDVVFVTPLYSLVFLRKVKD